VDTLASEYGWTKDYILFEVYPLDAFSLMPKIQRRQLNRFVDQLVVQVMTKSDLKSEEREKWLRQIEGMRQNAAGSGPAERPLDREKLEMLREAMGRKKGKGPVRVK
jgi:hypothetical protein